jgi:hypothetical protein
MHHDFTGEWLMTGSELLSELLIELNVGWIKRQAASAMGYGVGKVRQTVSQTGDLITVEQKGGQKDFTNVIKVGGGPQQCDSADGMVPVTATWAPDGSLKMETEMMGAKVTVTRRRTDDKRTVIEIDTGKIVATRIFSKQ